jgi:hypothetical protein
MNLRRRWMTILPKLVIYGVKEELLKTRLYRLIEII